LKKKKRGWEGRGWVFGSRPDLFRNFGEGFDTQSHVGVGAKAKFYT